MSMINDVAFVLPAVDAIVDLPLIELIGVVNP
jgi:hypothetical protein